MIDLRNLEGMTSPVLFRSSKKPIQKNLALTGIIHYW